MNAALIIQRSFGLALAALALALGCALNAKADLLELTNGDHYRGTVVSINSNTVEFLSEIQGRVHLPRTKVAQITFREVAAKPVAQTNAPAAAASPVAVSPASSQPVVVQPLILSGASNPQSTPATQADAVVQQMRQQGIQPQLINQVQEQIFGKASPEAAQKFNEIMGGLMSGSISVQDLRAQALDSIKQARAAKSELGGDAGEMLDGYIGILEKFVNESSTAPAAAPAKTQFTPSATHAAK